MGRRRRFGPVADGRPCDDRADGRLDADAYGAPGPTDTATPSTAAPPTTEAWTAPESPNTPIENRTVNGSDRITRVRFYGTRNGSDFSDFDVAVYSNTTVESVDTDEAENARRAVLPRLDRGRARGADASAPRNVSRLGVAVSQLQVAVLPLPVALILLVVTLDCSRVDEIATYARRQPT